MTNELPYHSMSSITSDNFVSKFTTCCCCIPIRTGCFILGYLHLVFNSLNTLALVALTTYLGITTHGFDHVDRSDDDDVIAMQEQPILNQIGILLTMTTCVNLIWLASCIACLVGLHKKKAGPIRLYVGFASARIMLAMAALIYVVMTSNYNLHNIIVQCLDIGLTAYFIMVYYIYAMQLERERTSNLIQPEVVTNDITFIYPSKIDREMLVSKEKY